MKYLMLVKYYMYVVIIIHLHLLVESKSKDEGLMQVTSSNNFYCGDIVTYECTVYGGYGGLTVWMGDFFHCSSGKRAIELIHSHFSPEQSGEEASNDRVCNDGDIAGRIVRVVNDSCFISQLNVTLIPDIAGKEIECVYDNGTMHTVGSLNLIAGVNISLTSSCGLSDIHFNWDTFPSNCSDAHLCYSTTIVTSNCDSCSQTTTSQTILSCRSMESDVLINVDNAICEFSVQSDFESAICYGEWQNKTLKIPRCPGVNHQGILLYLVVILPLVVLLLLLASFVGLSLYIIIYKKRNRRKALFGNGLHKEHKDERYGRNPLAEDDTKAVKIFDNEIDGTYNLEELENFPSEIQKSVQEGSIQLTLDNLLIKLQEQVSSHWHQFGLSLGVPADIVEQLKDYSDKDALVEILDYWLKHHSHQPTWKDVGTALRKAGFNDINVD